MFGVGTMKLEKAERLNLQIFINRLITLLILATIIFCSSYSYAGDLNLSNSVLETTTGVEPNVMILNDDSGSMDHGVMIPEGNDGNIVFRGESYKYAHPDPGVTTKKAPAANIKNINDDDGDDAQSKDLGVVPTEAGLLAAGVAVANQEGIWRTWNHNYNRVYYNPHITYIPWKGLDKSGNLYGPITSTVAPYNPYDPSLGGLNLTTLVTYTTRWEDNVGDLKEDLVNNMYPARYYLWLDANTDKVVDPLEPHLLVEIKSSGPVCPGPVVAGLPCPSSYIRASYDFNTNFGRKDCSTDNGNGTVTCTYSEELQNFKNWFSYYRKRDLVAKAALSLVIENATNARVGYATLHNNSSVNTKLASMNKSSTVPGAKKDLLDKIFTSQPTGGTPLRQSLEKLGRYFECKGNTNADEQDIFGATSDSVPGDQACAVLAAPQGTCQQNYAVAMTDGYYNGSDPKDANDADDDDDTNFDGDAFAGSDNKTLADVAMHFYERDLHGTLTNAVPTTQIDVNRYAGVGTLNLTDTMHQHMTTYSLGLGVNGTLTSMPADPNVAFAWPDPDDGNAEKIDDLRHAAYNGRGGFNSANDPQALAKTLTVMFEEIGIGEGAASSVAFNTHTIQSDSVVYRAFFNTQNDTGDLVAQRINSDGTLNTDSFGNPILEWSAASQLDSKTGASSDSRTIITYEDNGLSSAGKAFRWTGASKITVAQQALLDAPVPANVSNVGDERLNYLRGHSVDEGLSFDDGEFRTRPSSVGKLGDFVHSTPVYVGKPPYFGRISGAYPGEFPSNVTDLYTTFKSDNASRQGVVYIGANDGMLHAFEAATGEELFAYVPSLVFNNLSELTKPDYSHRFYVDSTPSINDIFMVKDGDSSKSWNSVLVGGLGHGGKGYYALNVTDPSDFNTETNAAANVMWEFTEADDGSIGNSDLGYTYSEPLLVMSNAEYADGEKKWVAIFGNGYNNTSSDGDAAIYILFIEAGQDGVWTAGSDYIKISTGYGKAESSDGTTPNGIGAVRGIDIDGDGTVDRLYAGDLQGNLYRIDLTSTNASDWDDASSRNIIFKARYGSPGSRTTVQPITTRPIVVNHPTEPGYIVITATGSWMTSDDATSTDIQSIYGIWDNNTGYEVTMPSANNQLVEQVFTNQLVKEHGFTVRSLSNNAVNWKDNGNSNSLVMGWYIDFDMPPAGSNSGVEYPGERAVRNLQLRGDFLFVNSIIPKSSNPCNFGAGGFELAFNPITGGSGSKIIFDISADGLFDLSDNINDADGDAYIVTGMRFDSTTPTDAAFIGQYRLTQQSDRSVRSMGTNTANSHTGGRNSWRELIIQ